MTFSPATQTLLEKSAADNGFDRELPRQGDWLGFASSHAPLELWLTAVADGSPVAALSRADVAHALNGQGSPVASALPEGAAAALAVADLAALHRLLRRAWQLARTLPDELLNSFIEQSKLLPRATEAERLVIQRVGQDVFRKGLLEYWQGRCALTGLAVPELLRASHIKPWADCASDAERLDVFNGLLLAPHLDAAFDAGFFTVENTGEVMVSAKLPVGARKLLGLDGALRLDELAERHRAYLSWHRLHVFKQ